MSDREDDLVQQSSADSELEISLLLDAILYRYRYDFRGYSRASLKRQLIRACNHFECDSFSQLQHRVMHRAEETSALLSFLTIQVSDLFRDPAYFKAIREEVVPIIKTFPSINIWVAGCATGEEVYSLAILLREEELESKARIYATDISAQALKAASSGVYSLERMKDFSTQYLQSGGKGSLSDYYTAAYNAAKMDRSLQGNIVFAEHNLVSDADFAEMHLISCRNVLIYFETELQARVATLFHKSLCRQGFLGLGSKENLRTTQARAYFENFIPELKIFRKR